MTQLFSKKCIKRSIGILIFLFIGAYAFSQSSILETKISVPQFTGNAKQFLDVLSAEHSISFAYSSNVSLLFNVSFDKQEAPLDQVLQVLFKEQDIEYKVNGTKIILFKPNPQSGDSEQLHQTVRGHIVDADSKLPLIGATILILGSNSPEGTATDLDGNFRFEHVPIGRIDLQIQCLGYKNIVLSNIEVRSGKEVVLPVSMEESALKLDGVEVTANKKLGEADNDMSLLSARSITVEETKRFTGGMDDPARMVTSYAGVTCSPGGSSDIIVRGNSPKYMQWRLDGIEITSPYHMDDQNSSFGALTALNKYLLQTSDFHTGAFAPEYGNVLSNVMDVKLREGNNEKYETNIGIGLMGTDVTFEGPFKKGYNGSFLLNYRYSTVSLINNLGLLGDDVSGLVSYQDATAKIVLPTKKIGKFSLFGLFGLSDVAFVNILAGGLTTPGQTANASIVKDFDKRANLFNAGLSHTISLSSKSFLRSSVSFATNGFSDYLYNKQILNYTSRDNEINPDSLGPSVAVFASDVINHSVQIAISYNIRLNSRNKIQVGSNLKNQTSSFVQDAFSPINDSLENVTDFRNTNNMLRNYISWKHKVDDRISIVAGIHNMNVLINKKSTIEPRVAFDWQITNTSSIKAGYGRHSTMEKVQNYFTKIAQPDGSYLQPNKNLDVLKANHYVLGYTKRFSDNLQAKLELYYQHLYNLPVEDNDTSYYATINESTEYKYVALVNEGVGKNYGVELTLERFFDNNYYFLINGSVFESKYKSLEGVWRNTMYNSNYIVNILFGKEFTELGKKQNKTLALNSKIFFGGAQRYIPLLRDAAGNVSVNSEENKYWDYSKAYDSDLTPLYNVNVSISYKINTKKFTHELFLDLMNVANSNAKLSEFYDESQPDNVGYEEEMFFLPNIMYKIYF